MRVVPLVKSPNQAFTITIDNVRWGLTFKEARGVMCTDIERDGSFLVRGCRVISGVPIIPYRYLQTANFIFLTNADDAPNWTLFETSQTLVYLSASDLESVKPVTAGEALAAVARTEYIFTDEGFYVTTETGELIENA